MRSLATNGIMKWESHLFFKKKFTMVLNKTTDTCRFKTSIIIIFHFKRTCNNFMYIYIYKSDR